MSTADVTLGITGHRVLSDIGKIEAGVEAALREVERVYPDRPLTAVSSLAEGADRLVAKRVLSRPQSQLVVVLPLPRDVYVDDFVTEESRREFRALLASAREVVEVPPQPTRQGAYEAAGRAILDRVDVLVAIWDGGAAHGRGGTADVVKRARACGLPLAWVHAGNRRLGTSEPTSLGATQGQVTFENIPIPR